MKAGHLLGVCAAFQLLTVCLNITSLWVLLFIPLSVAAAVCLAVAVYYKWKRGVEIYIVLSIVLIIVAIIPFSRILADHTVQARAYEFSSYCLVIISGSFSVLVSVWVLYHTDYTTAESEQKPLLERMSASFRNSFSPSPGGKA
mmetsp:Transcript_11824/g.25375  ORF Transcript_11824/g.25375 Transcript_11824/m.25375 type:complete len:144 (-) Transcript_11824:160-591(-)